MRLIIDDETMTVTSETESGSETVPLYSDRAFELITDPWVFVGWQQRYSYTFSWFGRPVIQLPEDMIRFQEVFWAVKPTLIIETGIAHGGSLIYSASLGAGSGLGTRVVGVDIEIRPHNRKGVEEHPLSEHITMIEGSSIAEDVLAQVAEHVKPDDRVMVVLDSNHSYGHVLEELRAYSKWVTPGSYIVSTDGIMKELSEAKAPSAVEAGDWDWNHPQKANEEFVAEHPDFEILEPVWPFNESGLSKRITHWPNCYLKRVR